MIVYIHVDGITVAEAPDTSDFLSNFFLGEVQTTGVGLSWFLGCAFERDGGNGVPRMSQKAFIESLVSRYGIGAEGIFRLLNRLISVLGGMSSRFVTSWFVQPLEA